MKRRLPAILMALLLMLTMLASVAACGEGSSTDGDDPAAIGSGDTPGGEGGEGDAAADENKWQPPDNYGGRQFIIGDWWSPGLDAPKRPATGPRGEEYEDYIYYLEQEWGFTVARTSISGWGDYLELFTTSVMAGDPAADIFVMSTGWAHMLMNQGLLYPLNTLDSIDVYADKWVGSVTEEFTGLDGNVYALNNDPYLEGRRFIYWNKRMFEEAGLDRDLPYDLQASGEWTWDKFLEICEKLTRDTDGDGLADVFAFCGFAERVFQGCIYSNNAQEIGIDADGKFYNAMLEPNFIEAMQFLQNLWDQGYWYDGPPDKDEGYWNWFDEGWETGIVAMKGADPYEAPQANQVDDWGMVFWPKGPRADDYRAVVDGNNVFVLPFNLSKDRAEEIMYAFNLFTEPLQYDLDNPDAWKYADGGWGYDRFNDSRAVDETMSMFYEGRYTMNARNYVQGGEAGIDWGPVFDWGNMGNTELTPVEKIEAAAPIIQAVLDRENANR